ncbi:hypothetical protein DF142_09755 [Burkholderia cenocepacia]|nr:hypothetical protein DF142_09755 [Burkholderia cenocepacia]RQU68524.1 hypothetical protein DF140_12140 [Burkholderia cenocepacia]RQV23257.1 hypothetical protein DF030_14595 [Burkholderia cenocepacia]
MVCNLVRRYAFETVSAHGFDIGKKVAHGCIDQPDNAARYRRAARGQPTLGLHIKILFGIVMCKFEYCQVLELS